MAGRKTFWAVSAGMTIIVLIVAALALYIYREVKKFSRKGEEFLQQGTALVNRANSTLDKVRPAADLVRSNLQRVADLKGARPLRSIIKNLTGSPR